MRMPSLQAVLEVLRASGCCGLRSVVIQLPPDAPLRSLHLDGCRQLHEVRWPKERALLPGRRDTTQLLPRASTSTELRMPCLLGVPVPVCVCRWCWWPLGWSCSMSATAASCAAFRCDAGAVGRGAGCPGSASASVGGMGLFCVFGGDVPPPICMCAQSASPAPAPRRLRELRAANCGSLSLEASELHCPALEEVNLFGNRQLDADGRLGACCWADSSAAGPAWHTLGQLCSSCRTVIHAPLLQGWRPQPLR